MKRFILTFGCICLFFLCFTPLYADECVNVKRHGPVSLKHFKCTSVNEIVIENICYDRSNTYLILKVIGSYHGYCGVTEQFAREFLKAPRKARYFVTHIESGIFDCKIFQPPPYLGKCK